MLLSAPCSDKCISVEVCLLWATAMHALPLASPMAKRMAEHWVQAGLLCLAQPCMLRAVDRNAVWG